MVEASAAQVAWVIAAGREGREKRYRDLPTAMPPHSLGDASMRALVAYLKGDLQQPAP